VFTPSNRDLEDIYFDTRHPAGFSNPERLRRGTNKKITKEKVDLFLQGQDSYTLHKNVRKKFTRNVTYADTVDSCWQTDLMDVSSSKEENDGMTFVLIVIDVFSRYVWTVPLKNKQAETVVSGFQEIFACTDRRCDDLISDNGKEFKNNKLKRFLKSHDINLYHTRNPDTKCSVSERFIRTLRLWLQKVFTHQENDRYIDHVLADVTHAYNHKYHRTLKMSPVEASRPDRVLQVYHNLYKGKLTRGVKPKLKIGDFVRISREKKHFEKGHMWNWSEEIFKITKVIRHSIPVYAIADIDIGEEVDGYFYGHELNKVTKPEAFKIDRVIKRRGRGDTSEAFVKWRGYPDSANSWILVKDIVTT